MSAESTSRWALVQERSITSLLELTKLALFEPDKDNMTMQVEFDNNTCSLTQLNNATFSINTTEPCVNEETTKTTTTLQMVLDVNGIATVIDQRQIECNREFTVNNELELSSGAIINQLRADTAIMTMLDREFIEQLIC